ncbi:hypothetical protein KCP71_11755 [Salmonella enterica subsp. enterica]|nr:hypothetical protein KCP71_11755 [Salmonella enterica subsp. enterica]
MFIRWRGEHYDPEIAPPDLRRFISARGTLNKIRYLSVCAGLSSLARGTLY